MLKVEIIINKIRKCAHSKIESHSHIIFPCRSDDADDDDDDGDERRHCSWLLSRSTATG